MLFRAKSCRDGAEKQTSKLVSVVANTSVVLLSSTCATPGCQACRAELHTTAVRQFVGKLQVPKNQGSKSNHTGFQRIVTQLWKHSTAGTVSG